ncbi:MAG: hypothetical protein U5M50_10470 [Sphingobium sp.]|nr:hypothetical protein [Sphingobium sp.]
MQQPGPKTAQPHRRPTAAPPRAAHRPTSADQLERASAALDELCRDVRLGARHASDVHDFEERAQAIAGQLIAAFRGDDAGRNGPMAMERNGARASAWW